MSEDDRKLSIAPICEKKVLGMIRRSCLLYLDDLKVNVDKYEIGQQVWPPRKIPISFFKCGSSCSGLKLSIAPICEKKVLGMIRRS